MKKRLIVIIPTLLVILASLSFLYPRPSRSVPSTNVKDVLSSSQLSYFARLGTGVSAGDSVIRVSLTSGTAPSLTTNNLFIGDTVGIGITSNGQLTLYRITDIGNTAVASVHTGLAANNAYVGAAVIATRSAVHTISFTPQSNIASGFWQFLIKATSRAGEVNNDGIPDQQGFDLGATTPSSGADGLGTRLKVDDVTCPNWGIGVTTAYSVGTTAVVAGNSYHVVTCYLGVGGTNQVGVGYSAAIGADLASGSQLINPAASVNHVEGNASSTGPDIYTFYVRHLDSGQNVIDSDTATGRIAVIEAVRVTATIDPTLTFIIDSTGVGVGATPCGNTAFGSNAANTTATAVNFGSLSLATNNDLAQRLSCVTNADNGYVVTAYESGQMKNISDGTTIPDTTCPSNNCSLTNPAVWNTYTTSGFGYTIQNINIGTTIFSYSQGYKPFGVGVANAQEIMKNVATPSQTETAYVCYRITAATSQRAGNYENKLVYTATATF